MNLMHEIHQRWAAATVLAALLPAARVWSGLSADATLPYAVIRKESDQPAGHFNDGSSLGQVVVRIEVFHESYDAGAAIAAAVNAAFDAADFQPSDADRLVAMRRAGGSEQQQDDGTWRFACDFRCIVHVAAAG